MVGFLHRIISLNRAKTLVNLNHCVKMSQQASSHDVPSFKELRIPVPWGHIAAKLWGNPDKKRVLAVHGWLDNASTFDRLVPLLLPDVQVLAVDLSGHGLSSHKVLYRNVDWVFDLRLATDSLQWERFSILGHSLGAGLANQFAAIYPEKVDKVICLDEIHPVPRTPDQVSLDYRGSFEDALTAFKETCNSQRTGSFEELVSRFRKAVHEDIEEESARILLTRGSSHVTGNIYHLNRDPKLTKLSNFLFLTECEIQALLDKVTTEVLLIRASDGLIKSQWKAVFDYTVPNSTNFKIIEEEGFHHIHLDRPSVVAPHIREFLKI